MTDRPRREHLSEAGEAGTNLLDVAEHPRADRMTGAVILMRALAACVVFGDVDDEEGEDFMIWLLHAVSDK